MTILSRGDSLEEKILMEICVDSIESALAAERGGADRIELCDNLMGGGTTPSMGMLQSVREYIDIDINFIVRPRSGDFCYSEYEFEVMKKDIEMAKEYGANGIVVGILKHNGEIDVDRMKEIIEISKPLGVTFHRAFDMTKDPLKSLDILIDLGVERILTSGQENNALAGLSLIKELVHRAKDKIIIMPGAGINHMNVMEIVRKTGVKEVHMSAKERIESNMEYRNNKVAMGGNLVIPEYDNYYTSEKIVRNIKKKLREKRKI